MYGTDKNNLTQLAEAPYGGTRHQVKINNLQPGSTYYFQVESGEAESCGVRSFETARAGQPNVQAHAAPVVVKCTPGAEESKVKVTSGPVIEYLTDHGATVAWQTNVKGSSRVMYGTDPNNLTQLAEAPWGAGGLTHRVPINNLRPNTTYYFQIETGQAAGLQGAEVESNRVMSFRTTAPGAPPQRDVAVR
jgi:phosphodiesterase/alkaline phosphatase D-like protein